jgi:hypothetical protein
MIDTNRGASVGRWGRFLRQRSPNQCRDHPSDLCIENNDPQAKEQAASQLHPTTARTTEKALATIRGI